MTDKKTGSEFRLEDFLPYRLSLLSNTVSGGISGSYRKAYGLSVTEWRVIAILGRFPGLTASEIIERGAMDKVAVSRAVKKLQEKELVERSALSTDRRRMPLKLTAQKGQELHEQVVPLARAYEESLIEVLTEDELVRLNRIIRKLQEQAENINQQEG